MNDKKQIQLLKDAMDAYENGEILEAKDMAIEFINNITDFEVDNRYYDLSSGHKEKEMPWYLSIFNTELLK